MATAFLFLTVFPLKMFLYTIFLIKTLCHGVTPIIKSLAIHFVNSAKDIGHKNMICITF